MTNNNSTPQQTGNTTELRKMLSTAALSTALVSWYTTANGLHQYVFTNIWQAYVISAALQGVLFTLSIRGCKTFFSFNDNKKRIFFTIIWICLLTASSIFSYSFIFKTVYSDQLLREDANRIFSTYCLEKHYELSSEADKLLNGSNENNGIINNMNTYVASLALLENGIELSSQSKTDIENLKVNLIPYSHSNTSNNSSNPKSAANCIDTSVLIDELDVILSGKYTSQDINDVNSTTENMQDEITNRIDTKNEELKEKNKTQQYLLQNLQTYVDITTSDYKETKTTLNNVVNQINDLNNLITALETESSYVNQVPIILKSIENSMASTLHNQVLKIRKAMNAEEIQTKKVQNASEEIYNILLDNSAELSPDDSRIVGYADFKNNLKKYSVIVEAKKSIEKEIEALYESDFSEIEIEKHEGNTIINDEQNINAWQDHWKMHMNSLKENAKKLHGGGLDEHIINNIIEGVDKRERLYISDINDFERAWSLLFNTINPYKIPLVFSAIIAFGIDIFSVIISILLYLIQRQK